MTHADQPLEERLRAHRHSAIHREAREAAAGAEAPRTAELEALAEGRLDDPRRRRALAEQLVAGDHWREALARSCPEPRQVRARWPARLATLAAAAALLLWLLFEPAALPSGALGPVRLTDPSGLELRGTAPAPRGRLLVALGAAGQLSLVREGVDGALVQVPVSADGAWTAAQAGEEVLLPLDGPVPVVAGERWVVVLSREALEEAATLAAARQALAGLPPTDPAVAVLVVGR